MEPVSVIVPNYKNEQYIGTCLDALFKNKGIQEVIVVDDHSTDDSLRVIRKFPVKVIENALNLGPVKSRNIGARAASVTSKYFLFLDGDAKLEPNYIESLVGFLDGNPRVGAVSGKVISEKGERMWVQLWQGTFLAQESYLELDQRRLSSYQIGHGEKFYCINRNPFQSQFYKR